MIDTELAFALLWSVHIRKEPPREGRQYTEDQRQRQKELINELIAEQSEQM